MLSVGGWGKHAVPPAAGVFLQIGGRIQLVDDFLTDDLFDYVLQRYNPRKDAVLVNDDEEVFAALQEFLQQLVESGRLGNGVGRAG